MKKLNAKLDYGPGMDEECIALCDALNSLPGVHTTESCCGHGETDLRIYFRVDGTTSMDGLFFLTRCVDNRYWKHGAAWSITLSVSDAMRDGILPICFLLRSGNGPGWAMTGDEAYSQAVSLVENMNHHLNHEAFINGYGLDIGKFVTT